MYSIINFVYQKGNQNSKQTTYVIHVIQNSTNIRIDSKL